MTPSDDWDKFQAEAFVKCGQNIRFDTNPHKVRKSYATWSKQPGIKDFCEDFVQRYCNNIAPGGRVADIWKAIYAFMSENGDMQQMHFESGCVGVGEARTVHGTVFKDGDKIDAIIKFEEGECAMCACFYFCLFVSNPMF